MKKKIYLIYKIPVSKVTGSYSFDSGTAGFGLGDGLTILYYIGASTICYCSS